MDEDSRTWIDPDAIPRFPLPDGGTIPGIGVGTFGSDAVDAATVAGAVGRAIAMGYRHVDCASVYGNEREIGGALSGAMSGRGGLRPVRRGELWITSKLWNDMHAPCAVAPACERSLRDLGLDELDLYLVHWPFPNYHSPGCGVDSRSPDARPYMHEEFMATWFEMEKLVTRGLVRRVGTSNMTIPKLELLLRDARIRPSVDELELHPHFQQPELFAFLRSRGILPIGYSPLGSPGRPERDRCPTDTTDMDDPVIRRIAQDHGVHPAAVCLSWAVQRGHLPIPFSVGDRNLLSNLQAVSPPFLTGEEIQDISRIDRQCRLIKGQVFLWEGAVDWRDLWDEDGTISG